MRWHKLFQDLELELERLEREAQLLEASDRIRTEFAQIELADRLRANLGNRIEFLVTGIEPLSGTLAACYPRWSLLKNDDGEALIPHRAIAGVRGLQIGRASCREGGGGWGGDGDGRHEIARRRGDW